MRKPRTRRPGPTKTSSAAEANPIPWSYFVVLAICGCILAAGFLLAARQHFNTMDLGMRNSKLRKQVEDLEAENRRLTLAREIAISPAEITKTARHLGFLEVGSVADSMPIPMTNGGLPVSKTSPAGHPLVASVTRTAYQRPANATVASAKPLSSKPETAKQRSVKLNLNAVARR